MTTDQWFTIIEQLSGIGTIRIKFQGGEPTLRPDFRLLCEKAKKSGLITAAVSHGMSISQQPDLLEFLDELVVSLDSPDQRTNDCLRGPGAYRGAVVAIEQALKRNLKTYVNMILTRENVGDLEAMLTFCESRGVRMHAQPAMFAQRSVYGRYFDDEMQDIALTDEQIRSAHIRLAQWKRAGRQLIFSTYAYQKAAGWSEYTTATIQGENRSSCMAGKYYIHIEPNGDIFPCGLNEAAFSPLNVLQAGLEAAIMHAREHNCRDCWMVYMNERKQVFGLKPQALWEIITRG
jgi:MoaA/NifB/PqqE/SkfB family radical SAM enzyme